MIFVFSFSIHLIILKVMTKQHLKVYVGVCVHVVCMSQFVRVCNIKLYVIAHKRNSCVVKVGSLNPSTCFEHPVF